MTSYQLDKHFSNIVNEIMALNDVKHILNLYFMETKLSLDDMTDDSWTRFFNTVFLPLVNSGLSKISQATVTQALGAAGLKFPLVPDIGFIGDVAQPFILGIYGIENFRFETNCTVTMSDPASNPMLTITNLKITCPSLDFHLGFGCTGFLGSCTCPDQYSKSGNPTCVTANNLPYRPKIMGKNISINLFGTINLFCCKTTKLLNNYKLTNALFALDPNDKNPVTLDVASDAMGNCEDGSTKCDVACGTGCQALAITIKGLSGLADYIKSLIIGFGLGNTIILAFVQPILSELVGKMPALPLGCPSSSNVRSVWCNVSSNVNCANGFSCKTNNESYTFTGDNPTCKYSKTQKCDDQNKCVIWQKNTDFAAPFLVSDTWSMREVGANSNPITCQGAVTPDGKQQIKNNIPLYGCACGPQPLTSYLPDQKTCSLFDPFTTGDNKCPKAVNSFLTTLFETVNTILSVPAFVTIPSNDSVGGSLKRMFFKNIISPKSIPVPGTPNNINLAFNFLYLLGLGDIQIANPTVNSCGIKKIQTGTDRDRYIIFIRRANLSLKSDSDVKAGMSVSFQSKPAPGTPFWLNTCVPDLLQNNNANPEPSTLPLPTLSRPQVFVDDGTRGKGCENISTFTNYEAKRPYRLQGTCKNTEICLPNSTCFNLKPSSSVEKDLLEECINNPTKECRDKYWDTSANSYTTCSFHTSLGEGLEVAQIEIDINRFDASCDVEFTFSVDKHKGLQKLKPGNIQLERLSINNITIKQPSIASPTSGLNINNIKTTGTGNIKPLTDLIGSSTFVSLIQSSISESWNQELRQIVEPILNEKLTDIVKGVSTSEKGLGDALINELIKVGIGGMYNDGQNPEPKELSSYFSPCGCSANPCSTDKSCSQISSESCFAQCMGTDEESNKTCNPIRDQSKCNEPCSWNEFEI